MTVEWMARIALALWLAYSIAFYGEGYRARGGPGLKTLAFAGETSILVTLIWVGFFLG